MNTQREIKIKEVLQLIDDYSVADCGCPYDDDAGGSDVLPCMCGGWDNYSKMKKKIKNILLEL